MKLIRPIVFFDLETTGVNLATDRIVQISTVKLSPDNTAQARTRLINPGVDIPLKATEIHGITNQMVLGEPTFKQIANSLNELFFGCDIGGFNSDGFDFPLLIAEFHRCGMEFPSWEPFFVDAYKIERLINGHSLEECYLRYTGKKMEGAHDAEVDTTGTMTVLGRQLEHLRGIFQDKDRGIEAFEITPENLDKFCQGENKRFDYAGRCYEKEGVVYWSFGKNKDEPVLDDRSYLNWVLNADFPIQTKNKLKELIKSQS